MKATSHPFLPATLGIPEHIARRKHKRILPGVYLGRKVTVTPLVAAHAAWLWSGGRCVLSGVSAAAVHGVKWLPATAEVVLERQVRVEGLTAHRDVLVPGDTVRVGGMVATSPVRTAFDLARRHPPRRRGLPCRRPAAGQLLPAGGAGRVRAGPAPPPGEGAGVGGGGAGRPEGRVPARDGAAAALCPFQGADSGDAV